MRRSVRREAGGVPGAGRAWDDVGSLWIISYAWGGLCASWEATTPPGYGMTSMIDPPGRSIVQVGTEVNGKSGDASCTRGDYVLK